MQYKKYQITIFISFILIFILSFSSALPTPTTETTWQVTHTTDVDYFTWFQNSSQPNTYACLLHKTATKISTLPAHKQTYIQDVNGKWIPYLDLNVQKMASTVSGLSNDYYGWCRNIDSNVINKIKLGENSTIWEAQTLLVYDTPTYDKDGFILEVSNNNSVVDVDWVEINGTNLFYPRGITLPRKNITFKQNILYKDLGCVSESMYYSNCSKQEIGYSDFEAKNNITNKKITPIYEDYDPNVWQQFVLFFKKLFGYEPQLQLDIIGYYIYYEGNIVDLDPSLIVTYSASTSGFYTNTTATALGIKLSGTNTTGNFSYFVYQNSTSPYWNTTIYHNFTSTNLTLFTRVANGYNLASADLVSLWGFNGNANDEKGVLNGTFGGTTGAYSESNGTVGQGYWFAGTVVDGNDGSYMSFANTGLPTGNSARTITAWINSERAGYNDPIIKYGTSASYQGWSCDLNTNKLRVCMYAECSGASTTSLSTNTWYHVAFVYYGNKTVQYYINGVSDGSATFTNTPNTGTTYAMIGGLADGVSWGGTSDFRGAIDEVKIYNRSLTATEIQSLYELDDFHLNWYDWQNEGNIVSGNEKKSSTAGYFFQFNVGFNGLNTSYLFNHSVKVGTIPSPPTAPSINIMNPINNSLQNDTIVDINYTVSGLSPDKCWYSKDGGTINSTVVTAGTNWTGIAGTSGWNNWTIFCNNSYGVGNNITRFIINLAPSITINTPSSSSIQDLVFNLTVTTADDLGIWYMIYNLDGATNTTLTNGNSTSYVFSKDLYASAGSHTINAYVFDTYGSGVKTSRIFTTRDLDTNVSTACSGSQILLANGSCIDYENIGTLTKKKFGYNYLE